MRNAIALVLVLAGAGCGGASDDRGLVSAPAELPGTPLVLPSPAPSPLPFAATCRQPLANWHRNKPRLTYDAALAAARVPCNSRSRPYSYVGTCGTYRWISSGTGLEYINREFFDQDGVLVAAETASDISGNSAEARTCDRVQARQFGIWTGCSMEWWEQTGPSSLERQLEPLCPSR